MSNRAVRVAHIVPSLDIGGVEIGILKSYVALNERFDYRVFFVKNYGILNIKQLSIFWLIWQTLLGRWRFDIVITSLWWAHPFGWLLSRRSQTWIAFFHSTAYAHLADRVIQKWAWRNADKRIADSDTTANSLQNGFATQCEVIPYIFSRTNSGKAWKDRSIDIVWVGRNSTVKRFDLFFKFLRSVKLLMSRCHAVIVFAGAMNSDLLNLSIESGSQVEVIWNADNECVLRILDDSRFYVLTSDHEGMSMSTVEAIQSGCLPVVRPVGEIANYVNSECGVLIEDISQDGLQLVAETVAMLGQDPERVSQMQMRAQQALNKLPEYTKSLVSFCNSVTVKS